MNFLKKLGQMIAKGIAVAVGIGPLVSPFLGSGKASGIENQVVDDLTSIGQVVIQAEAMIQTPGAGAVKLAAVTPLVASIVRTSQMVDGKKIQDEALFNRGAAKMADGAVDILNSLHESEAKTA